MKKVEIRALLLSLAIALLATGILVFYARSGNTQTEAMTKVIVAVSDIEARTAIKENQIKVIELPVRYAVKGSLKNTESIVGRVTKQKIYAGEQIIGDRLVQAFENGLLAAIIPEKHRAITIRIDDISGVGSSIKRGDYVDILAYTKPSELVGGNVKTIFQNILVLETYAEKAVQGGEKYVTLSMLPQDAEKLFLADESGKLRFILRPVADKNINTLPGTGPANIK